MSMRAECSAANVCGQAPLIRDALSAGIVRAMAKSGPSILTREQEQDVVIIVAMLAGGLGGIANLGSRF